ncbi:MAG: 4Fe-4S binding protein [Acidimicrobiia bacterium]|nr:4Fe-4S binding protein [Acidimicrobiia bacterium]
MTTVLICADARMPGTVEHPRASVITVEELCLHPTSMKSVVPDEETELVLALHRHEANLGAIQAVTRRLGFDPLAVGIVELDSLADPGELPRVLAAAIARVSHYPGSTPAQVKLLPPDRASRRSFLSIGSPIYVGAPMVDPGVCVAGNGCRICATTCPASALTWTSGAISFDVNTCVACGICVTSCPIGAIVHPTITPALVQAEIEAALAYADEPIGLRFHCRASEIAGEPGWHLVEVPCTGMLTVGWLLAPLALGAAKVDAVPCPSGGCPLNNDERLATTRRDVEVLLDGLGITADQAGRTDSESGRLDLVGWFDSASTGRIINELAAAATQASVTLESADIGSIIIDPATCTACQMCAQICPTKALRSYSAPDGVRIDFDPADCVACSQCLTICPEIDRNAITMTRGIDLADWHLGRREVRHDPVARCELCGGPVAPSAMLARIETMLGDDGQEAMALIGRRCLKCRGR